MDGFQYLDGWDLALILMWLVSLLLLVVFGPIAIGGAVFWLDRRSPPRSRLVRLCMGVVPVVVVLWGAGWVVSEAFGVDVVSVQTSGRMCRPSVMGGPPGVCEDMHLCAPVPDDLVHLMTACEGGPSPASDCPLQIAWQAAVLMGDDSSEWIMSADRAVLSDPDPAAYPVNLIWYKVTGSLGEPSSVELMHNNDAGQLFWTLERRVPDGELRYNHVFGPPLPEICAGFLDDPSQTTYEFTRR